LAEDDDEIRDALAHSLRDSGYDLIEARDGEQLLDLVADSAADDCLGLPFDAIVSDVVMPGFTALDVLTALRRRLARTPVILITAQRGEDIERRCRCAGAHSILYKPFDLQDFRAVVRAAIRGARR
jgi:DNA-binding response OmpR family regulator